MTSRIVPSIFPYLYLPAAAFTESIHQQPVVEHAALGKIQKVEAPAHKLGEIATIEQPLAGDAYILRLGRRTDDGEQLLHLVERIDLLLQLLTKLWPAFLYRLQLFAHRSPVIIFLCNLCIAQLRCGKVFEKVERTLLFLFECRPAIHTFVNIELRQVVS